MLNDTSNYKEDSRLEYERSTKEARKEGLPQRVLDDEIYQPKILARQQQRDKLDDLNSKKFYLKYLIKVIDSSISNNYSRTKSQIGLRISNPMGDLKYSQGNLDNSLIEAIYERNNSSKTPLSSSGASFKGASYASFQVAFGRTEPKCKMLGLSQQENRSISPSIIDVRPRKRIDHVTQTYDVIKGQEFKNK